MLQLARKISSFLQHHLKKPHNMHKHEAEQFYFQIYWHYIEPLVNKMQYVLDIGCQMGRFTIPLIERKIRVVATDINKKYGNYIFKYIKQNIPENIIYFQYRCESIEQTLKNFDKNTFDAIFCIELLYNLNGGIKYIQPLANLVKSEGYLITSHRTLGYYLYRFLHEKKCIDLEKIFLNLHPNYNWQTIENLYNIYKTSGLKVLGSHPIGMFSGFENDPFSHIANPKMLNKKWKKILFEIETNHNYAQLFSNNARYILMIGQKL